MTIKNQLKEIAESLALHETLTFRIMTAMIEEELSYSDFEYNMLCLASNIDDEYTSIQAIIDSLPDDDTKECSNEI